MDMFDALKIRELRKRIGLSMAKFGELVGVSESTVSLWESGSRHPKFKTHMVLNDLEKKYANPRKRGLPAAK